MPRLALVLLSALTLAGFPATGEPLTPARSPQRATTHPLLLPTNSSALRSGAVASAATANVQLPPEIMVDRLLVRVERLVDDPEAALEVMNEMLIRWMVATAPATGGLTFGDPAFLG